MITPDRVEINGVWYVKEDLTSEIKDLTFNDTTQTENIIFETKLVCFEAIRIKKSENEFFNDITMDVIDKRNIDRNDWNEESIDNHNWLIDLYNNDDDCYKEALEFLNEEMIKTLKTFLKYLNEINWIKL